MRTVSPGIGKVYLENCQNLRKNSVFLIFFVIGIGKSIKNGRIFLEFRHLPPPRATSLLRYSNLPVRPHLLTCFHRRSSLHRFAPLPAFHRFYLSAPCVPAAPLSVSRCFLGMGISAVSYETGPDTARKKFNKKFTQPLQNFAFFRSRLGT